jgi:FlaA1/EpsC-like NDP-sugar epimerase
MKKHSLRILVVGAGETGTEVLEQLRKNPSLTVLTLDPQEEPHAVTEGVIQEVDFHEQLTPLTLKEVLRKAKPDLVLWTMTSEDLALGETQGVDILTRALRDEIAALAEVPVIKVARDKD